MVGEPPSDTMLNLWKDERKCENVFILIYYNVNKEYIYTQSGKSLQENPMRVGRQEWGDKNDGGQEKEGEKESGARGPMRANVEDPMSF